MKGILLYLFFATLCLSALGQSPNTNFKRAQHINVYSQSLQLLKYPWVGGLNNPIPLQLDVNGDYRKDLVIYDRTTNTFHTFLNNSINGTASYVHHPEYMDTLKNDFYYGFKIVRDYNCDGIPDLLTYATGGIDVYKGYYENNKIKFEYYKYLKYPVGAGDAQVYCSPGDIPIIEDLDNDGDLDIVTFDLNGTFMTLYKNMRVELGQPCDSITFLNAETCWGYMFQDGIREHRLNYSGCAAFRGAAGAGPSNEMPEHGSNNILYYDLDGDGVSDLLMGNQFYSDIQAFYNGRAMNSSHKDSMVVQDTIWKDKNGKVPMIESYPAISKLDVDLDGIEDLIFSPMGSVVGENVKVMQYYRASINPSNNKKELTYVTDNFLNDEILDFGYNSYPYFYDYNKDGKPDLLVTSNGKYKGLGQQGYYLSYLQNESSGSSPSFMKSNDDLNNIGQSINKRFRFSIGDVNGDQLDDLVLLLEDRSLVVKVNVASSNAVSPDWQTSSMVVKDSTTGNTIKAPGYYNIMVRDVDGDGINDLLLGDTSAHLIYYRTTSQSSSVWEVHMETDKLGDIEFASEYATSFYWGPIDASGEDYILLGHQNGGISIYRPNEDWQQPFTKVEEKILYYGTNYEVTPTVADVDGDGAFELVVGGYLGGLQLFSQNKHVGFESLPLNQSQKQFQLYPNPTSETLFVRGGANAILRIYNITGQLVMTVNKNTDPLSIKIADLPEGLYMVEILESTHKEFHKLQIMK